jgi:hypothetical protein
MYLKNSQLDNFVTIKTFTYPHEVAIIRGRLESEGIECVTQDELMAQVNPFYSNAIGGVKLQVRERDLPQAIDILKETGYLTDADFLPTPLFIKFDKATSGIPLLKDLRVEFRLMVIVAVMVLVGILCLWVEFQK